MRRARIRLSDMGMMPRYEAMSYVGQLPTRPCRLFESPLGPACMTRVIPSPLER